MLVAIKGTLYEKRGDRLLVEIESEPIPAVKAEVLDSLFPNTQRSIERLLVIEALLANSKPEEFPRG